MDDLRPTLDTERLTLVVHQPEDFADVAALWADPAVVRFIGGKPFTEEEAWWRFLRNQGHWALLGYGYWTLREKASGRFVGEAGFADLHRAIEPSYHGTPEAGWVLASWAHGRGFASEAMRAILAWGDAHFGARRTVCIIDDENSASVNVAQKIGYREVTRTTYHGNPVILFDRVPGR
jgi:RimJ/RimL family protein N-acetyltransferase